MCCVKTCAHCAECVFCEATRMCSKCAKYLLFIVNFIFFLCGAALLVMGLWMKLDPRASDFLHIVETSTENPLLDFSLYFLIGIGSFIFVLGFMGCCGACCDNPSMLCFYIFLVIIAIVGQILLAILAAIYKDDLNLALLRGMADQVNTHYTGFPKNDTITVAFNRLQIDMSCCGSNGFQDYQNSYFTHTTKAGCYHRLHAWIQERSAIVAGVAAGLLLFQILCVVFACLVRKTINRDVSALL